MMTCYDIAILCTGRFDVQTTSLDVDLTLIIFRPDNNNGFSKTAISGVPLSKAFLFLANNIITKFVTRRPPDYRSVTKSEIGEETERKSNERKVTKEK